MPKWSLWSLLHTTAARDPHHRAGRSCEASVEDGARARRAAGEAGFQAQDRLRVQLRDARLGHAEHLADLAQRELFVVVERHDELLALGQACDRLADGLLEL